MLRRIWNDQRGQDTVEYALIAAFITAAAMALSPAVLSVALYLGRVMHILDGALGLTAAR
jgi:Flp pilus assembly pilin Flp